MTETDVVSACCQSTRTHANSEYSPSYANRIPLIRSSSALASSSYVPFASQEDQTDLDPVYVSSNGRQLESKSSKEKGGFRRTVAPPALELSRQLAITSAKAALRRPRCRWPPELVPVAAPRAWRRWTGPLSVVASAWASGPTRSSFRAGIPSARTASGKTDAHTLAGALLKRDIFCGWKSKYACERRTREQRGRRCPLCRGTIPPSRDQISSMKLTQLLMKKMGKSDPAYEKYAQEVKQFEAEYGEDWEGTAIEYNDDCVSLPFYVINAAKGGNFRTALQWLGNKGNIKDRVNAKCELAGNQGLLTTAAVTNEYDLMTFLLLNGADVNIINSAGLSVLSTLIYDSRSHLTTIRLLLSWGAEIFHEGRGATSQEMKELRFKTIMEGNAAVANLISSELGGRRCKMVSAPDNRDDLVGKTCVVGRHIKKSDQYEVTVEFTNESLLLGADNLERYDRTPHDPGCFVECKNNRLIRRDFESNEECRAFIASLGADEGGLAEVDPEAEAKAEQAAADLLAELGLDDLEDASSNAPKKGARSAPPAGKKKKRGGKKKGRNSLILRRRLLGQGGRLSPQGRAPGPPLSARVVHALPLPLSPPLEGIHGSVRGALGGTLGSYFRPIRVVLITSSAGNLTGEGDRDGRGCCRDGSVCRSSCCIPPRFPGGSAASLKRQSGQTASAIPAILLDGQLVRLMEWSCECAPVLDESRTNGPGPRGKDTAALLLEGDFWAGAGTDLTTPPTKKAVSDFSSSSPPHEVDCRITQSWPSFSRVGSFDPSPPPRRRGAASVPPCR
ncbi:hypothetical protein THAOC_18240, partial [Thalassiosira oceanica]